MARRPAIASPPERSVRLLDGGFRLVAVLGAVLVVAMAARLVLDASGGTPAAGWTFPPEASGAAGAGPTGSGSGEPADLASYIDPAPSPAPPIELTDPNGQPFALSSLRGGPVLVFFGYTHCPDVCPATIGTIGLAMDAYGPGVRAVFVSIDPERDTGEWLREYVRFLPAGFTALTGTPAEIRSTADAWGVKYARVETGDPNAYSMSHTATVYLVDADGLVRARFPFGTESDVMTAVLKKVVGTAAPSASATPSSGPASPSASPSAPASATPTAPIDVDVVSTAVWAGGSSPVILDLLENGARVDDLALRPRVQLFDAGGQPVGVAVEASPVQPPGLTAVSYVAALDIPTAGAWRIRVTGTRDGTDLAGTASLNALDPGGTAALGAPAPSVRTPTLTDVGGNARAVTTDPAPDLRLSERSTSDALAAGQPFVLVVDSTKFRVSPACGRAIIMARYLLDRWRDVAFIHLEPYRYSVISDTPVLEGSLDDPKLNDPADAWGVGAAPWGVRSMPWAFVVDGAGVVRAKYQGVMGSADVDVILAWLAQGG
jgi:protein SCO1/2